jgi:hypothetical protein
MIGGSLGRGPGSGSGGMVMDRGRAGRTSWTTCGVVKQNVPRRALVSRHSNCSDRFMEWLQRLLARTENAARARLGHAPSRPVRALVWPQNRKENGLFALSRWAAQAPRPRGGLVSSSLDRTDLSAGGCRAIRSLSLRSGGSTRLVSPSWATLAPASHPSFKELAQFHASVQSRMVLLAGGPALLGEPQFFVLRLGEENEKR